MSAQAASRFTSTSAADATHGDTCRTNKFMHMATTTTTAYLCTGGLVRHYTGGSRNRLWCTACDVKQHHRRSIKNRL
jgi:hypothetical protein